MIFWIGAGVMAVIAAALVVPPLLRRRIAPAARASYDLEVYKDQLREVDNDLGRGVLSEAEAEAARTEIRRRILAAADQSPESNRETQPAGAPGGRALPVAAGLAVIVPLVAVGIYLGLGEPGTPSLPLAERPTLEAMAGQDMATLVEDLATRLAESPEDPRGWILLARSQRALGRFVDAAESFRQAIARGADDAETQAEHGEVLIGAMEGIVAEEARTAFRAALARDPGNHRARYYLALAKAQDGDTQGALDDWRALRDSASVGAPWLPVLNRQIAEAEGALGLAASTSRQGEAANPGPTAADMDAAADMSPEDRAAFIRSMVDRLAARLADEPDDLDGWLRLARAYGVLGETEEMRGALGRILELSPDHLLALFQLGELEAAAGNTAEATRLWRRVADLLPADAQARAEVEARIEALGKGN